jgi:hypothetical protein
VLFDGLLDGSFICAVRSQDPQRQAWVLRGDKLFYAVRSDPFAGYVDWSADERSILETIHRNNPSYIVLEEPPGKFDMPGPKLLRLTIAKHPDKFIREQTIPVEQARLGWLAERELHIYKYALHDPLKPRVVELKMLWQGTQLSAGP